MMSTTTRHQEREAATTSIAGALARRAESALAMARDTATQTYQLMGTKHRGERLTTHCPPYRTARRAVIELTNASLRLWELACLARLAELGHVGADVEADEPIRRGPDVDEREVAVEVEDECDSPIG